ncbi:outer membrane beta-barrel protein [Polaribacter batillariae]|uniref:Outer membrane beta-barrel protein n=1 Tax=Polaribacter batillariae TaxID=2808900 RepID=A0ABX7SVG3_9FLAO|nr:outer membrane beta-barrel protein [Polaribacter batillariae]QTD36838.1 outer membrane beta-barrel protein [Polaribacter batillariae]
MKTIKICVLLFSICIFKLNAQENTVENKSPLKLKFLLGGALEFGGDSVAEIYFEDDSNQSVNAGQGGTIFAGGELFFSESQKFSLRATVGFKYVTTKATNYNITLTRIPLDLSANYMIAKDFRLGAGIVSHQNIKFNADGLEANETFTGGFGPKFEFAWKWIGISYTIMNYKDSQNNSYNANAIGITLSSSDLF